MSRLAATGFGAALALVVLGAPGAAARNTDQVAPQEVRNVAFRTAEWLGDAHPTGRAYDTTSGRVKQILEWADAEPNRRVYLIVLHGRFEGSVLPRPAEAHAPTGRTVAIVWDPAKQQVTDLNLRDSEIDTDSLGSGLRLG